MLKYILYALIIFTPLTQSALAQGAVKSTYGDWQIRCDSANTQQKSEQCAIMQSVSAETKVNVGLTVIVLRAADKKKFIMRVLTPLGILIPSGLGLKIDSKDVGRAGFVRCLVSGCVAEVEMDDELMKDLSQGKQAIFFFYQSPDDGLGIPIVLNGFAEAVKNLP